MIIGLTGSYGSGKSTVASMLQELGDARIIDADHIARSLQRKGQPGYHAIVELFGPAALQEDGELDRRYIAERVFTDKLMLEKVNRIIHPLVWHEQVKQLGQNSSNALTVLMVPLLYETGADKLCDKVVVVVVNEDLRETRLQARDNVTVEQVRERLATQMPQAEKMKRADYVITNHGSLHETQQQVKALLQKLATPTGSAN